MFKTSSLPFSVSTSKKIEKFEKELLSQESKFRTEPISQKEIIYLPIIINEEKLKIRKEILINFLEKILLEEAINYYSIFLKIGKTDLSFDDNFHVKNEKIVQKLIRTANDFLKSILKNSYQLNSKNKGLCAVIPLTPLVDNICRFNEELQNNFQSIFFENFSNQLENFSYNLNERLLFVLHFLLIISHLHNLLNSFIVKVYYLNVKTSILTLH